MLDIIKKLLTPKKPPTFLPETVHVLFEIDAPAAQVDYAATESVVEQMTAMAKATEKSGTLLLHKVDGRPQLDVFSSFECVKQYLPIYSKRVKASNPEANITGLPSAQMKRTVLCRHIVDLPDVRMVLDAGTPDERIITKMEIALWAAEAPPPVPVARPPSPAPWQLDNELFALYPNENGLGNLEESSETDILEFMAFHASQAQTTDARTLYAFQKADEVFVPVFSRLDDAKSFLDHVYRSHKEKRPETAVAVMTVVGLNPAALRERVATQDGHKILLDPHSPDERVMSLADLPMTPGEAPEIGTRSLVWVSEKDSRFHRLT